MVNFYRQLIELLPAFCQSIARKKAGDFTKHRKLPLPQLIVALLFLAGGSRRDGVDIKLGQFYKAARRSGLWPQGKAPHRSALTKARHKLDWAAFADLLHKLVELAYAAFPRRDEYTWQGLSVFAFDGSKYTLPPTQAIRDRFDPGSGFGNPGKGHYPQALVNTAYDVFRRLPVRRSVRAIPDGNERDEALALLAGLPEDSVSLFDRGYPSYAMALALVGQRRNFIMRCPAQSTFPAVEAFVRSGKKEAPLWLLPSDEFRRGLRQAERETLSPLRPLAVRLNHPDGTVSVLLVYLSGRWPTYPAVIQLYYRRWAIENHYRDEKVGFEVERFHAKNPNGVMQELFSILVVCVIARTLSALSVESESVETAKCHKAPQLKNAVHCVAQEAALFAVAELEPALALALAMYLELVDAIRRVMYYRPKTPRPSRPRVNKGSPNKWQEGRAKKMRDAI